MTTYNVAALKYRAHTIPYCVTGRDNTSHGAGASGAAHDAAVAAQSRGKVGDRRRPTRSNDSQTDNNSAVVLTDGGRREVDPHIEPEYVGAHSGTEADECQLWTGETPTPCDNAATHTIVHYSGKYHFLAACDECGEPDDVEHWGRQWSAAREEVATDGGQDPDTGERIEPPAVDVGDRVLAILATDDGVEYLEAIVNTVHSKRTIDAVYRVESRQEHGGDGGFERDHHTDSYEFQTSLVYMGDVGGWLAGWDDA